MRAIDGALRVDQSYELQYTTSGLTSCDNCGNTLKNIAIVKGNKDKQTYHIGLNCAETLVGITPDDIKQAKKAIAYRNKIRNRIRRGFYKQAFIVGEMVFLYTFEATPEEKDRWYSRMRYDNVKQALAQAGTPIATLPTDETTSEKGA